jgi:LysM repeat protein
MSYQIQPGDTLSGLAQRFHTTVDALMKANPQIKNADLIQAGQPLKIPGAKAKPPGGQEVGHGGRVDDWIKQAMKILEQHGVPAGKMNAQDIALIIQHESGGNPEAQNNWDSNAKAGHPSIGLMQTIQPTFDAHRLPGHDNIRNPVDNIIAGVRYAISRYGSISNVPGVKAVHSGGKYVGY